MKKLLCLCFFLCWLVMPLARGALPVEVRADLLKDEIISAVRAGDYLAARQRIGEYRKLELDMPAALMLLEAKVAAKTQDWLHAKTTLEHYFTKFGKADDGYASALDLYKKVAGPAQRQEETLVAEQKNKEALEVQEKETRGYKDACNNGSGASCFYLGAIFNQGIKGRTKNAGEAVNWFSKGCEADHATSCFNLGAMTQNGEGGLTVSLSQAADFYRKACELDQASPGCHYLARLYRYGGGVEKNLFEARRLYKIACQADKTYCPMLEKIPKTDQGLREEYATACVANSGGHGENCFQAAAMYGAGRGGPADPALWKEFHEKGCWTHDHAPSCYVRGMGWFDRYTADSDNTDAAVVALKYFREGCRLGHDPACAKKQEVEDASAAR